MAKAPRDVDGYIDRCDESVQRILRRVREIIAEAVPEGEERIAYGMPTVTVGGNAVVHYAAWKHHVALYGVRHLSDEVEPRVRRFRGDKGTISFPLAEPIPFDLISDIADELLPDD